jgi:hypothetical protein
LLRQRRGEKNVRVNAGSDHVSVMMMMSDRCAPMRNLFGVATGFAIGGCAHLFSELSLRVLSKLRDGMRLPADSMERRSQRDLLHHHSKSFPDRFLERFLWRESTAM